MPSCQDPSCHCNRPTEPQTVPCTYCGDPTDMTATKLCDQCWEVERRLPRFLKAGGAKALAFVLAEAGKQTKPKFDPSVDLDLICQNPTCEHPYERHFDTYEDMRPVGCKYCNCQEFVFGS
jgi:hypothetical protein